MTAPRTAKEVAAGLELSPPARLLLTPGIAADAYFDALVRDGHLSDAIRFAPPLLGVSNAVWWGALCARHALPATTKPAEEVALKTVVAWLREPTDAARRAANAAGKVAGAGTPAGLLAAAVFFSGGSLAPPKSPEVPADPAVAAKLAAQAVLAAARAGPPAGTSERQRTFLRLAVEVYRGRNRWS